MAFIEFIVFTQINTYGNAKVNVIFELNNSNNGSSSCGREQQYNTLN